MQLKRFQWRVVFLGITCLASIPAMASTVFYVSSNSDGTIQAIDSTGVVNTFATGLSRPRGLAIDPDGNLYVATEDSNDDIIKITPNKNSSVFASMPGVTEGLAFYNGYLFAGVNAPNLVGQGSIIKIAPDGSTSTYASAPDLGPDAITFGLDGNLYVASGENSNPNNINRIDSSGNITPYANIFSPFGTAFDSNDDLFVSSFAEYPISRVAASFEVFEIAPNNTITDVPIGNNYILGLAYSGNVLYGCDATTDSIVSISSTGAISTVATGFSVPTYILAVPEPTLAIWLMPALLLLAPRKSRHPARTTGA